MGRAKTPLQSRKLRSLVTALFLSAAALIVSALTALADPPFALPAEQDLEKLKSAVIETDEGKIFVELYPEEAPWHVANFKYLADKGCFRNVPFAIFKSDYIIQSGEGCQKGRGIGYYTLPPEFSERRHVRGTLGMARMPNEINPERRSSATQFHLLLTAAPHMDGGYTIFGKVVDGLEVLDELRKGSVIRKVRVFVRDEGEE